VRAVWATPLDSVIAPYELQLGRPGSVGLEELVAQAAEFGVGQEPLHEARRGAAVPINLATGPWRCFTAFMGSQDRQRDQPVDARDAHAEPRGTDLEGREADLERREAVVGEREAVQAERMDAAQAILAAAEVRDVVSDDRDTAAEKRESDLDRAEMLDPTSEYGAHWPERRHAHLDRVHAQGDRRASRQDLNTVTEGDVEPDTDRT
jgi:uncharacterized protein (DUF3084 family)